jgi:thiamine biosynthesis lipoprotein
MTLTEQRWTHSMTFRAMGCPIGLTAVDIGPEPFADDARAIIDLAELWERRFSRFRPESALSRLNAVAGQGPQPVEPALFTMIARACAISRESDGFFNPLVLPALIAAGYDRPFRDLKTRPEWRSRKGSPAPAIELVELNDLAGTIALPVGAQIDLGGIAKGAFVDAAVAPVAARWPGGVINAGGDLRLWGMPPDGPRWRVGLEDPALPERNLAVAEIRDPRRAGAIATSGRNRRRWPTDRGSAHHLIDPRTGKPACGEIETATVFAADATTADIAAKILLLSLSLTGESRLSGGALGVTLDDRGSGTRWEGTDADAVSINPLVVRTGPAA